MTDAPKKDPVRPAPKRFCGVKACSGPKAGNKNAMRTGTGIDRRRLVVGELPRELICVRKEGRAYRVQLEKAVLEAHGEISVTAAHHLDTATAATVQAAIIRWCLRRRFASLSTSEVLACSRELVKAKKDRDAAVRALDLDAPPPNPWDSIDVPSKETEGGNTDEA